MLLIIQWNATIIIIAIALSAYYWWLLKSRVLQTAKAAPAPDPEPAVAEDLIPRQVLQAKQPPMFLPPAIERFPDPEEETFLELLEQKEGILLREAELVVHQIQKTIDNIASNPPNPEEVTSKIRAIVEPYHIFHDTEYYHSINTYIALALERDCQITLTPQELQALWN
ncbi:hypothetical protein [Paraflavitalea sp. CAU 1676]|uniref:hypothetical protein n=1 Tax=Paraflavitalea sp. CAU 1676 TaxID=3032598 RepID=UPI0023D99259|nr:hypothetical protein [Paraflavitalea sp. CAU 1676]MDF2191362.1 hypothetical protein [Paraflavitalea sp. CAU 1676]